MEIEKAAQGARRGAYVRCSPELKPAIVAECLALGASVAAAALAHGVNANLVRKWIEKARPSTKAEADVSWFSVVLDPSSQPHRDALIHHSDRGSHGERCYHQLSVRPQQLADASTSPAGQAESSDPTTDRAWHQSLSTIIRSRPEPSRHKPARLVSYHANEVFYRVVTPEP
jgi:hypothetical protein